MKRCLGLSALLIAAAIFGFTQVHAEEQARYCKWYVGASGGINWVSEREVDYVAGVGEIGSLSIRPDMDWKTGRYFAATAGYSFCYGFRLEGELARRSNDLDRLMIDGAPGPISDDGEITMSSVMLNVIYEIPLGIPVRPYIGAGAGAAYADFEMDASLGVMSDDNWAFAWQAIAGLNLEVAPEWEVFAQYQYFRVPEPDLSDTVNEGASFQSVRIDEYESHTASLGVRYRF